MTEQELKDTKAFFESPTGKKYLDAPARHASRARLRRRLAREAAERAVARMREEMKKKGY